MKFVKYLIAHILLLNLLVPAARAQYKQGLKHYNRGEYYRAVHLLQKAARKSNEHTTDAALKLADCYRMLREYKQSEIYYKKALDGGNTDPLTHFYYGSVLKCNNHYEEALKEFKIYLKDHTEESRVKNAIISCNEIRIWLNNPKEYELTPLSDINTQKSEFGAVVNGQNLVYVSEQAHDLVNYQECDYNGHPYLNVFYVPLNNTSVDKVRNFGKNINTPYHDGPVCFSADSSTMYITRVGYTSGEDRSFVNHSKIYILTKKHGHWEHPIPFDYNSNAYSVAHPALSADGQMLFFSSDMPGGYGGKDIYMCHRDGDSWDLPVNLGSSVNSSGDEVFPFIRKDKVLFFSSDGHPGFGGLDVFSAREKNRKWVLSRNEGLGINSFTDDFSVFFTSDSTGYISSDRDGGMGGDDIYRFTFSNKYTSVDGIVLNSDDIEDVSPGTRLLLFDDKGSLITTQYTDEKGYFSFKNLPADKKYLVKIDEEDPGYHGQKRFYYANQISKQIMQVSVTNDQGDKFTFRNLPLDANALPELDTPDDISLGGILMSGTPPVPIANTVLLVKNEKGHVVQQTKTNAFGSFVFHQLLPDDGYYMELADNTAPVAPGSKIILKNSTGTEVRTLIADEQGKFRFKLLDKESSLMKDLEVKDEDLLMNIGGKVLDQEKKKVAGVKVFLTDENGIVIDSVYTDEESAFEFKKLKADDNYTLNIDSKNEKLRGMNKIYVVSNNGDVEKEVLRDKNGEFKLRILKTDKADFKELYVEDPWLDVLDLKNNKGGREIIITENVYYASGDYRVHESGYVVLDKIAKIMKDNPDLKIEIISHTDSKANDEFNMKLSQKRAKTAVEYIVSKGISKSRLSATGLGESKLINQCGNFAQCTEEEHAKNRRTEFKVIHSKS